ncbi:UBX domain-containing protein 8 isoform X5 [Nycticebus coucang]|uniref:UBX domain-containing protein 8 isoform X5 n=1 Tax=Nycticebus coucang TaxID=9470 RepID=UPI00234D33C3|nr:UBX domain-containing protein 8 isoform X5 [Nycticebus coucang]
MASRGVVGIFFLSALPLLCLELRRGIPEVEEEEKNEKRQKLTRKKQQEIQGEKGNEDSALEHASQTSFRTSNREAARRRSLPKPLTKAPPPAEQPTGKEVDLPEEPPETAEEIVTIALRCLSGSVQRRRFFKSSSSQVLFDWMMKIGYDTSLYSLFTSFPRRALELDRGLSLEEIGITVDTVLNVEEKEQSH